MDECAYKRCTNDKSITWLGYPLCSSHWGIVCQLQDRMANEVIFRRYLKQGSRLEPDDPDVGQDAEETAQAELEWRYQMAKAKKKSAGKATRQPREVGKISGLTVRQTWLKLFKENVKAKKSDDQVLKGMLREFPGKQGQNYTPEGVHDVRRWINKGHMDGQTYNFQRYDSDGSVLIRRAGRPTTDESKSKKVAKGKFKVKSKK